MINLPVKVNLKIIVSVILIFLVGFVLGLNLLLPLFLVSFLAYFECLKKANDMKNYQLLPLIFLFTLIFSLANLTIQRGLPESYIPFCAIPMLAVLLYNDLRIAMFLALISSAAIASLAGNNFNLFLIFSSSGIISAILIYGCRKRSSIIKAGFFIGLLQALALFFADNLKFADPAHYFNMAVNGLVSAVIVIGTLPVFEYLFGVVTNVSLLELADFNHPLLQRMTMEAPGTYHHSLIVGNLSDAACQAVGANGLLARIGAYYHDIGKLSKPEYFSENQNSSSKHDDLAPSMSKIVIMNHVKEGVDLAKKYRLNPRIIDFIQEHHGDSLVFYFYRRALENAEEQSVQEEGFRYPGPKPKSKEAAIVLLADSVEAATRTLKDHSPSFVEEMVHKVINNKFIDGQLDECDLTLKNLEKIAAVFIRILSGIYHNRITYPEPTSPAKHS